LKYQSKEKENPDELNHDIFSRNAVRDFSDKMSYGSYLNLEKILSAQQFVTHQHDEALFIIIHQVSELWIKLMLLEMDAAQENIRKDNLKMAFKMFSRVSKIQEQLVASWGILSTMTPPEFQSFRESLGNASGFQSYGYREIEYRLGNKNPVKLKPHSSDKVLHDHLVGVMSKKSLYDETIALLHRSGLKIDKEILERDFSEKHVTNQSVRDAWYVIYSNTEKYWDLYELAEKLVDIEDSLKQWRFRHLVTVSRTIGVQKGTGGTDGASYLENALKVSFFPELWEVRGDILNTKNMTCPFNYK